jgi:tetratricopeptide (TPR) repeat protein
MSNWQSNDSRSPFGDDAVVLAEVMTPKRRFRLPLIIIGGACVMLMVCGGIGAYFAYWLLTGHSRVVVAPAQSTEQKIAESTTAYASDDVGVDADVLAEIERLFQRVSTAVRRSDNREFRRLVDCDFLFARVQGTGLIDEHSFFQQMLLKTNIRESLGATAEWRNCGVMHVVPVAGIPDNAVVYTCCRNDANEASEFRWWLVKRNNAWRIYDWERLDLGLSASRDWAIRAHYQFDSCMYSYARFETEIVTAAGHVEQGDLEAAEESLRRAAKYTGPPELEDCRLALLGYNWRIIGRTRDALQCFDRISNPQATPGGYYGKAMCYHDLGMDRKALEQITLYETHVGPLPDVLKEKVVMLSSLGRDEEVLHERRRIAKMNPDDTASLRSLGFALPKEKKGELVPLLKRTSDPAAVAADLAWSFSDDRAGLRAVLSVIEELQPDSPEAAGVAGLLAVAERDYERAVSCCRTAFDRAAGEAERSAYLDSYLEAMSALGRYRAALEEAPDIDLAFDYFSAGYDEGESELTDDEFLELVEIRRRQRPDDPWVYYYAGSVYHGRSENEAAERELRTGLEKGGEDADKSMLRSLLANVLLDEGRTVEAYETLGADDERFRQLASFCRWNERPEPLRELIAAHRKRHPDSPWIDFYQAWLHDSAGEMELAIELYRRSLDEVGPDNYLVRGGWVSACLKADRWEEVYRESESPEDGFAELAGRLSRAEKWEAVESLRAIHAAACPEDPALLDWEVALLWHNRDYLGLIDRFTPPPREMLWELGNGQQSEIWEKVVRSHLRLGQLEHAKALAEVLFDENEYVLPLVLAHAASGDRVVTQRWFGEWSRANSWFMGFHGNLYRDEDIGHILMSDAYRPLREKYPINATGVMGDTVAVLLLDEIVPVELTRLRDAARELVGPEAEAVMLNSTPEDARFVIRSGLAAVWGVVRKGPLPDQANRWESVGSESLQESVDGHQAWLAVGRAHWRAGDALDPRLTLQVADRLAGEHGVAMYVHAQPRLVDWDDTARHTLAGEEPLGRLHEMGENVGYYYFTVDRSADRDQMRAFRKKLYDVANSYAAERPGSQLDVRFGLSVGPFHEPLWLRVERVEEEFNDFRFIGPLLESSSLSPIHSASEFVELYEFGVVALRYRDGDRTVLVERWPGAGK